MKRKNDMMRQLMAQSSLSAASFWSEVFTRAISYLGVVILAVLILSTTLNATVEQLEQICLYVAIGLAVLWCIPFVRLTRMRLRDAGFTPKTYLWLLLPVLGWIIFAGFMCAKSKEQAQDAPKKVL